MSDQEVRLALDAMERMLQDGVWSAGTLEVWRERFDAAMASAERGPEWAEIANRSRSLSRRLDLALTGVLADRDAIRREMSLMAVGGRALKGYKPSRR